MPRTVRTDDVVTIDAAPVRLAFRWDGRRWTHGLDVNGRALAASVEWEPDRDEPSRVVSPAYQQLDARDAPDGSRALLVGQWGLHHGSAVFDVSEEPAEVVIDIDVAVRSRGVLHSLASTYRVDLSSSDLIDAGPSGVVWGLGPSPSGVLRFEPGDGSRVGLAEAGRRATRVQADTDLQPGSATHRLRYRWRWLRVT